MLNFPSPSSFIISPEKRFPLHKDEIPSRSYHRCHLNFRLSNEFQWARKINYRQFTFCRLITFAIIARDMLEWILSFAFVGEKCAARAWRLVYGESSQSTSPPRLVIIEKEVRLTISRRHSSGENISFDSWKLKVYFELKLWGIFTTWLRSRLIPRCVVVIILIRKSHNHV